MNSVMGAKPAHPTPKPRKKDRVLYIRENEKQPKSG